VTERFDAPGLAGAPGYSHAAASSGDRLVLTAGAVPLDAEGNLVGSGDRIAQTRQVLDNLGRALEVAGSGWEDVLKTTVYVVAEDRKDLADVWSVVQGSPVAAAASTLLGVSLLGYEGQLVEIEAVAVAG
jgi:enamine deaminase RidA (YjgF/YER057c/UK114 family)